MGPQGPGFPSALPALRAAASRRRLPVLVVGAGANGDVIEPAANWDNFVRAAAGGGAPTLEVVLTSCGHLQFLDKQVGAVPGRAGLRLRRQQGARGVGQAARRGASVFFGGRRLPRGLHSRQSNARLLVATG
jgi:hypothetical protein